MGDKRRVNWDGGGSSAAPLIIVPELSGARVAAGPAAGCCYDVNYLGLLARQGKLEARKWDRRWYSTLAALARYREQAQAEPRGRPPRRRHVPGL